MTEVDFDAVEPGVDGDMAACRYSSVIRAMSPSVAARVIAPVGLSRRDADRDGLPFEPAVGHRAGMTDLGRSRRPGGVHRVGEPAQAG